MHGPPLITCMMGSRRRAAAIKAVVCAPGGASVRSCGGRRAGTAERQGSSFGHARAVPVWRMLTGAALAPCAALTPGCCAQVPVDLALLPGWAARSYEAVAAIQIALVRPPLQMRGRCLDAVLRQSLKGALLPAGHCLRCLGTAVRWARMGVAAACAGRARAGRGGGGGVAARAAALFPPGLCLLQAARPAQGRAVRLPGGLAQVRGAQPCQEESQGTQGISSSKGRYQHTQWLCGRGCWR